MTARAQILVVGAGTAGAAAAAFLAEIGREVLLVDAQPLDRAGARWMNGLPAGELQRLGIDLGQPEHAGKFHLIAGRGPERITVPAGVIVDHDMRALVEHLQDRATRAGAELRGQTKVQSVEEEDDGVMVTFEGGQVSKFDLLVDAAGLKGPSARSACSPTQLCVAAQSVRTITDLDAAQSWMRSQGAEYGETLSFSGVAGGYSIVNAHLSAPPNPTVAILTGSIPALGHPSGVVLLQRFVDEHPWIGPEIFGGARAIPLTAPDPVVGRGRVARIGDAARQVYASHGSGIVQGIRAARRLADVIDGQGTPWDYNVSFQREDAGALAATAAVAAWTARLPQATVRDLIAGGLLHPHLIADGLRQAAPRAPMAILPDLARAALRHPRHARHMAPTLVAAERLQRLHKRYPSSMEHLGRWVLARHRLLVQAGAV